jgi:hypothetical protein
VPATITPTTFADGVLGSGSLRDAVLQLNADAGTDDDIILLHAGTYALTIVNSSGHHETAGFEGDLNITNTSHRLIVQGVGSSGNNATIIDAGQLQDRAFQIVNPNTQVVFQDLVITGGLAQDDGSDGALAGSTDARGGGILNNGGDVTLDNVVLTNNVAQGGDVAVLSAPGHSASGGGIYSTGGALTMAGTTLANNAAIGGRGGNANRSNYGGNGGSATGAGLYATGGSLDISDSMIASNRATGGRGGDGYVTITSLGGQSYIAGGYGGTGQGGGLYVSGGSLTIATSTIATNQGTGGTGGFNTGLGLGQGGGLSNIGTLTVSSSTLSGNLSGNSASLGFGGGIYNAGTLTVGNSTLCGNTAYLGGGIYNYGTRPVTLTNVTLTANRASIGFNFGVGGGLFVQSRSPVVLHNTLIAGNFREAFGTSRDDVYGALNSGGDYNLIGDRTGMTGLSNGVHGNLVGSAAAPIDPLLGPLADNGGPTLTHALLSRSPAIDAGNNAYATDWDQRGDGFPRIVNDVIDIGAFEYQRDGSGRLFTRSGRSYEPAAGALLFSLPRREDQPIILSSVPTSNQDSSVIETDRVAAIAETTLDSNASSIDAVFASFPEKKPGKVTDWWDDLEAADAARKRGRERVASEADLGGHRVASGTNAADGGPR